MIDVKLREQLEDRLYDKMSAENEAFLADMKTKPVDEIIQSAYQIAWRENMLYVFESPTSLTPQQLNVLLELKQPMAELYDCWLGQENDEMDNLRECMAGYSAEVLQQRAEDLYADVRTPLYTRSFADARCYDEVYEWRADHNKNLACSSNFANHAGAAFAEQRLQPFLQQWTEEYGVERCMFVLACTMAQRKGDGRFYPPAKQAAARFSPLIESRADQSRHYTVDTHSCIVNAAMEHLAKPERQHAPEKPQSKKKTDQER